MIIGIVKLANYVALANTQLARRLYRSPFGTSTELLSVLLSSSFWDEKRVRGNGCKGGGCVDGGSGGEGGDGGGHRR